jgi:tRNA (guanine-N7-)-methyltransferase
VPVSERSDAGPAESGPAFIPRSWRNRGRMPEGKRVRLAERAEVLAFADAASAAVWAPDVLDIGFGYGESLLALATDLPACRILGVDVHAPGQLGAMDRIAAAGLTTVRVLPGDVTALLPLLAPGSLHLVQALHPDPWPKRRHADRRLFGPRVLARCARLLAPGGVLHVVTDDDTYATALRADLTTLALRPVDRPPPPETRYGRRAVAAGRVVHQIAYTKAI